MPRIAGVDLPLHKKVLYGLQAIYGIGLKVAQDICQLANVDPEKRVSELTNDEVNRIQRALDSHDVEGDLRRKINDDIDRLKRNGSYRGRRHIQKLPVRGQRTRTNSRNARGSGTRRATVGSMTKEMAAKLESAKNKK